MDDRDKCGLLCGNMKKDIREWAKRARDGSATLCNGVFGCQGLSRAQLRRKGQQEKTNTDYSDYETSSSRQEPFIIFSG